MSIFSEIVGFIRSLLSPPKSSEAMAIALDKMAAQRPEKLDWRNSIVDLMKLTNQDSSLAHRERWAKELGYPGPYGGTAEMNNWLHKRVMADLAKKL